MKSVNICGDTPSRKAAIQRNRRNLNSSKFQYFFFQKGKENLKKISCQLKLCFGLIVIPKIDVRMKMYAKIQIGVSMFTDKTFIMISRIQDCS